MKKEITALNKIDLYLEMSDFADVYPKVTYGDIYHIVESSGYEYWGVIATI